MSSHYLLADPRIRYEYLVVFGRNQCPKIKFFLSALYRNTVKLLKIQTLEKIAVIILKAEQDGFTTVMHPKHAEGIANIVDLDQTSSRLS